jgi:uncharacterized protein
LLLIANYLQPNNFMFFISVLSPAKSLRKEVEQKATGKPVFLSRAAKINKVLRTMKPDDLMELQGISRNLGELNALRNKEWKIKAHEDKGTPAMFTFTGDVYQGLDAETLSENEVESAQDQLLILSGLYGVLRPQDAILPYRLEMGTKLSVSDHKDLYAFWKKDVVRYINTNYKGRTLVNLASNEYGSAIDKKTLKLPVIEVEFKDFTNGKYKIVSFYAKKARGLFARFMVQNVPKNVEELQAFSTDGYFFDESTSETNKLVFLRG